MRDWTSAYGSGVSSLARYCSARGIGPSEVSDEIFGSIGPTAPKRPGSATHNTAKRFMVRAWNACAAATGCLGLQRLTEPPLKTAEPAWEAFPATACAQDVDNYFAGLAKVHRTLNGKRIQPCSATTIATRRAELVAMARMAVRLGVPIESLSSLAALLHPDVVEKVIDAYWAKNGDEPKTFTIDLGKKALRMARETGCLDQAALERLDDIRVALEHHRREGLTPKNLQLIRQVLTDGIWNEVVSLPNVLMQTGALGQGPRADQSCRLGAACCCHRDPHLRARSACQSRQHRVGPEPHQAGRAEHAVLARIPALRCEEPSRSEFSVRSATDGSDR